MPHGREVEENILINTPYGLDKISNFRHLFKRRI